MSNYTSSYVIQSAGLALKIQDQYLNKAGRVDKGVHRQSIWVLWRTSMPSVLTEIGYLTNPQEEKFLGSEKGQSYLAACLFRAFRKYKDEQEGVKKTYDDDIENQVPLEKEKYTIAETKEEQAVEKVEEEAEAEVKKENKEVDDKEKLLAEASAKAEVERKAKEEKLKEEQKIKDKAIADAKVKEEQDKKAKEEALLKKAKTDSIAEAQKNQAKLDEQEKKYKQFIAMADVNFKNKNYQESLELYKKANTVKGKEDDYASRKIKDIEALQSAATKTITEEKKESQPEVIKNELNKTGIVFKVQFAATEKEVDANVKFPKVTDVWFYKVGTVCKYTSGNYSSMDEATKHQTKLKELGYKDCFVAAFKDGVRMDINEAKKLTQ
jgi:N-acetylmuramoyl-L-alanine amidase